MMTFLFCKDEQKLLNRVNRVRTFIFNGYKKSCLTFITIEKKKRLHSKLLLALYGGRLRHSNLLFQTVVNHRRNSLAFSLLNEKRKLKRIRAGIKW